MSLKSSLMAYVANGRLKSFHAYDDKKAQLQLVNGSSFIIYMATQYVIGEADVHEACEEPAASYLIYNTWDSVGRVATTEAARMGLRIYTFGAFGRYLDTLNAAS